MNSHRFQTRKKLSVFYGLSKVMGAQLLKKGMEPNTEIQREAALALENGIKNIKQNAFMPTWKEIFVHKLMKKQEYRIRTMIFAKLTLSLKRTGCA